jgi:cell division control protein 11
MRRGIPADTTRSHLTDLKEITHDFLYENYRTEKLSRSVTGTDV